MAASKDVKCIQITVWLGNSQEVQVIADERYVNRDPCKDDMNYTRREFTDDEVRKLMSQIFSDLNTALKGAAASIAISVEGSKIVPR